jgi:polyisoprenoid-binding protein YceI
VTRPRVIVLSLVAIAALLIGGVIVYDQVLRGDAVEALALPSSSPAASASGVTAAPSVRPAGTASAGSVAPDGVAGTWSVGSGSQAGYRVRERLANLPAESDAVGRTSDVSGSITLEAAGDGARLTAGTLTVDTTTIASEESRRDNRMRSEGLQTDQFPTASFAITQPVDVPAAALAGTASDVTLVGDLTLHGVTKAVQIPATAQLLDGSIQVAGSLTFVLADFQISPPNVGGFILSIADQGTLEFLVTFTKA